MDSSPSIEKAANVEQPAEPLIIIEPNLKDQALTEAEAEDLLESCGKNLIAAQKPPKWYKLLFSALIHPFNGILLVLAVISGATQDYRTMTVMLLMIVLSVGVRFVQEYKSNVAAEALKKMVKNEASVIRRVLRQDGIFEEKELQISMEDVVPGDHVVLRAGDMVPGDVQLLQSKDIFISQAALTGEALAVEKYVSTEIVNDRPEEMEEEMEKARKSSSLLDRTDMCFMGTSLMSGMGRGVVLKTGNDTVFGKLATELAKKRPENAFQKGLKRISWLFVIFMSIMVLVVFILNGALTKQWLNAFTFSIAVAVGLTPEMLPMVVNANLARGAYVMSKKKAIIKQLESIMNFGAIDVLCTDKTGTLTMDKVVLLKHQDIFGQQQSEIAELAFLNATFQTGLKNLLDIAVIDYFAKIEHPADIPLKEQYVKLDEKPFDFVRRRVSVLVENVETKKHKLICKGAVEEMLRICSFYKDEHGEKKAFDEDSLKRAQLMSEELNKDGLRVVAVAYKKTKRERVTLGKKSEKNLVLVGFLAFLDPPKETAKPAIEELLQKGITVKVLTGDSPLVCQKVCNEVGLESKRVVTGKDLEGMKDEEKARVVEEANIFAKLSPAQKAEVVTILKNNGHVVGFLGDGINDATALKTADVGISVDTAVDVAKESANIILLEKSLMVLVQAVLVGRMTYANTIKYIKMTGSSNFGNVFSVTIAAAWLPFLPMLPIHLVVQNLLYDFSQCSIPWDAVDKEFIAIPRKWEAKGLAKFMLLIGPTSSIFDMVIFCFMWFYFGIQTPNDDVTLFQTAWFVEGLLTQTLIVHMIRTEKIPFIQSRASWPVIITTVVLMAIGIALPFSPLNNFLKMEPLPGIYFAVLFACLGSYVILTQIVKLIFIRVFHHWL